MDRIQKRQHLIIFPIFILIASFIFVSLTANAEDVAIAPLNIRPILPDNQKNKQNQFFDLEVTPGLEQVLEIEFTNNTDDPMRFDVEANSAKTNINGIIDYSTSNKNENTSMVFQFSNIVDIDPFIIIPPNEKKIFLANIKLPEDQFDGIVAGGLIFNLHNEEDEEKQNQIESKISYTIGVVLSQNDNQVVAKLDFDNVNVERIDFRNYIQATIQNNQPMIMDNVNLLADVKKKGESKVLYSKEKKDVRLAPNSNFTLQLDTTGNKAIEAGTYVLNMIATYEDKEWTWSEEFEVTDSTVKSLDTTPITESIKPNYVLYFSIALIVITGGVILRKLSKKSE